MFRSVKRIIVPLALILAAVSVGMAMAESGYDPHGKRDPMVPLIGQDKTPAAVEMADITSIEDVRLEGIAVKTSGDRTAIINGELVKEGYKAGEIEIISITKDSVSLAISGKDYTVNLSEEGGQKE